MKTLRRSARKIADLRHEVRRLRVEMARVHEDGLSDIHAQLVDRLETAKTRMHRLRRDAGRRTNVA
jgi:hypothetical protein